VDRRAGYGHFGALTGVQLLPTGAPEVTDTTELDKVLDYAGFNINPVRTIQAREAIRALFAAQDQKINDERMVLRAALDELQGRFNEVEREREWLVMEMAELKRDLRSALDERDSARNTARRQRNEIEAHAVLAPGDKT
jgi:hypothetical protein